MPTTTSIFASQVISPGQFEPVEHWYPRALNAQIHPMVAFFMNLSPERVVNRYCHLNPQVDRAALLGLLDYQPKFFFHAGADLFHVTTEQGNRRMVVLETNSSPSGQKSMPLLDENIEQGGYFQYIEHTFKPQLRARRPKLTGGLAVIYDKNLTEASGYASAMADAFQEPVHLVPFYQHDENPPVRFVEGVMEIRDPQGQWLPIRAAFRYVTQRPWNRIPVSSKTLILNPIIACLAGGRNKMMAAKAYDFFNAELEGTGLSILTPETIRDVRKSELPLYLKKFGGQMVVKVPYSNAGQGVYTIVNEQEFDAFMQEEFPYDLFIVQSLIGNYHWSSISTAGRLFHVGTMPDKRNHSYVADVRMMVGARKEGMRPLAIYARRARTPLVDQLDSGSDSWDMLGTNLSIKEDNGTFSSDSSRLMMMDRRDFNKLGLSMDSLIEGYIQTVLSIIAIDKMAQNLINQKGKLKPRLFRSLNNDDALIQEIMLD
jgi:hypothetical protein